MKRKYPPHGWLGIFLVIIFWHMNWNLDGLRTHWMFFPLWLGFILAVDGLVYKRQGTSLIKRNLKGFILLFVLSVPLWWLFELFNEVLQNWNYEGREYFSDITYALYASLNFSIVLPAVFESAELVSTFNLRDFAPHWKTGRRLQLIFFVSGWIMLFLLLVWPEIFFPLVWVSVYFIVEPVNYRLGFKNLFHQTEKGNWR
ncbi:MAG: hypothetical protein GX126_02375, partial [Bacteroidales bacterium]|nr:hypothetical protein [Bacteroidales bacterium]